MKYVEAPYIKHLTVKEGHVACNLVAIPEAPLALRVPWSRTESLRAAGSLGPSDGDIVRYFRS